MDKLGGILQIIILINNIDSDDDIVKNREKGN